MTVATANERLHQKIELVIPALRASSEKVWRSPHVTQLYPVYLSTVHMLARAAVPLLEAALERARSLAGADPVAAGLVPYLAQHAPEEEGHAQWLLEDLEALGADPTEPWRRIPSARVATLVGAQYYWLLHHHPTALLGFMAVIEGYPPQVGFADRVRRLTGYPSHAFRAIARHERLDIRHARELHEVIDRLPLDEEHEALIGLSALHTVRATIELFEEIEAAVPRVCSPWQLT
jgi:hypothetical protein